MRKFLSWLPSNLIFWNLILIGSCAKTNICECEGGWSGVNCDQAICSNCSPKGGKCVMPEVCDCLNGWSGESCTTPKCSKKCENGGNCVG